MLFVSDTIRKVLVEELGELPRWIEGDLRRLALTELQLSSQLESVIRKIEKMTVNHPRRERIVNRLADVMEKLML